MSDRVSFILKLPPQFLYRFYLASLSMGFRKGIGKDNENINGKKENIRNI